MAQKVRYHGICTMTDRQLISHLCSYAQWRALEKTQTFKKLTLVESCICCGVDIGITITKDRFKANLFNIEISAKGGNYSIITKKKYGSDFDIVGERKQISPKSLEENNHDACSGISRVKGTPIKDEWIALPYRPPNADPIALEDRIQSLRL